ncbi:hypothetical protein FSP39_020388 [Pinctada imbricata]|uniref:Uncharacterized protein n=1 Tax=Pinctada imbricata TaxID=66713 RepID=A0AA89C0M6_PINIB|nr:hypothetical protein FSP39_020388 [Pinctada imbricata]
MKGGDLQQDSVAAPIATHQTPQVKTQRRRTKQETKNSKGDIQHRTLKTTHKPTRPMGNRCRLRTAISHVSNRWCGYPGLRAHNPPTFPFTQSFGTIYARTSTKYTDFVLRTGRLSDKLLSQGYVCDRLTSSLRKFYGPYGELVIYYDAHSPEWWMIFCQRPFEPSHQRLYLNNSNQQQMGGYGPQPVYPPQPMYGPQPGYGQQQQQQQTVLFT